MPETDHDFLDLDFQALSWFPHRKRARIPGTANDLVEVWMFPPHLIMKLSVYQDGKWKTVGNSESFLELAEIYARYVPSARNVPLKDEMPDYMPANIPAERRTLF